jgi:transglutaminase-like putative cysteine protease
LRIVFRTSELGGGRIKRKIYLSVVLLFSLVLVLNVSAISAASVNTTHINATDKSLASSSVANNISNYASSNAKTNVTNTSTKKIANKTSNVTNQAAGAPVIVNGLTVTQLKDGISRAEAFYKKYHRLPAYINYGTRKIPIATFQKNIASQGLKISTTTVKTVPINTSSVSALAKSLSAGCTTDLQKATKIYNWVRDNINYAFYYNTKYGAAGTLTKRLGNCCDTANLLVALARDAGINARYVHGTCKFSSGNWYGHVWAQVYVNGKWVNADATSSRNSLGVIKNWNTATYKLVGVYNTLPF